MEIKRSVRLDPQLNVVVKEELCENETDQIYVSNLVPKLENIGLYENVEISADVIREEPGGLVFRKLYVKLNKLKWNPWDGNTFLICRVCYRPFPTESLLCNHLFSCIGLPKEEKIQEVDGVYKQNNTFPLGTPAQPLQADLLNHNSSCKTTISNENNFFQSNRFQNLNVSERELCYSVYDKTSVEYLKLHTEEQFGKNVSCLNNNQLNYLDQGSANKKLHCSVCRPIQCDEKNLKLHMRIHENNPIGNQLLSEDDILNKGDCSMQICTLVKNKNFNSNKCQQASSCCSQEKKFDKRLNRLVCKKTSNQRRIFKRDSSTQDKLFDLKDELRFSCSKCHKTFRAKSELKSHELLHTGKYPFSCSICLKTFRFKRRVKIHMRIHTGEMPYSCSVCKKKFRRSDSLIPHRRFHTGETPFSCAICDQTFRIKESLQTHIFKHIGVVALSCKNCKKKMFSTTSNLKKHGEDSCPRCNKPFRRKTV